MYVPKQDMIMRDMKHVKKGQCRHFRQREEVGSKAIGIAMAVICCIGWLVVLAFIVTDGGPL